MNPTVKQLIVAAIGLAFAYCGVILRMGSNNVLVDAAIRITSLGQSSLGLSTRIPALEALSSIGMALLWTGLSLIVIASAAWLFMPNPTSTNERPTA